jgi:hypothetical protein
MPATTKIEFIITTKDDLYCGTCHLRKNGICYLFGELQDRLRSYSCQKLATPIEDETC